MKNKIRCPPPKVNVIIVKRPAGALKVCGKQGKGYLPLSGVGDIRAH